MSPLGGHGGSRQLVQTGTRPRQRWSTKPFPPLFLSPLYSLPMISCKSRLIKVGPAAQLQVSGDLTKMIDVFAEDWLDMCDQELSGFRSIDVHDHDFKYCSGDKGSLGFDPHGEFMGRFGYSQDHGAVEFAVINISVMDL